MIRDKEKCLHSSNILMLFWHSRYHMYLENKRKGKKFSPRNFEMQVTIPRMPQRSEKGRQEEVSQADTIYIEILF